MKIALRQTAPDGVRFAPDVFDSQIGTEIPVRLLDGIDTSTTGRLLSAKVADDGRSVELTLDIDAPAPQVQPGDFSFA